ncbi:MAG: thioredoxin family protein [Candidatus Heimdallarchaeota archaeon]|nr:thioredoxin family protein [Candidatus Heimdallarchaeota archaeon]
MTLNNDDELLKIREKIVSDIMSTNVDADGTVKILNGNMINDFITKNKFAIIDFYATWCPPCKIMDPITKEMAQDYKGKVAFGKINTDNDRQAAIQYQIRYVPTFYLFKDGEIVFYFSGAKRKKDFMDIIKKYFKVE